MPRKTVAIESKLGEKFVITTEVRGHKIVIDQPTNAAGTDTGPTPLEMLLVSLAGCIGSIGRIIAMQKRLTVRGMNIKVEGDVDTDGLLGKSIEGRIGFEGFIITVDVDADMTDEEKETFIHELDRRCPVSENLLNATPIQIQLA